MVLMVMVVVLTRVMQHPRVTALIIQQQQQQQTIVIIEIEMRIGVMGQK
jgi:hypothetical protein